MKIVFAEQIGVSDSKRSEFISEMQSLGHTVSFFDTPVLDQSDLQARVSNADVLVFSLLQSFIFYA